MLLWKFCLAVSFSTVGTAVALSHVEKPPMVNVRFHPGPSDPQVAGRFNVLLTEGRPHADGHWSRQIPRLLEPHGVRSYVVRSGEEAVDVAQSTPIHAAVIDLGTPRRLALQSPPATQRNMSTANDQPGGIWLLDLFRRMENNPPVVVVRSRTMGRQQVARLLNDALRRGAFTVMESPDLEQLLRVFQALLERVYQGTWPGLENMFNARPNTDPKNAKSNQDQSHH